MKRIRTEVDGETRLENCDGLFTRVEEWPKEINDHTETEMFLLLLYLVSLLSVGF